MYLSTLQLEFHQYILILTYLPCPPTYTFFFTLHNDSLLNMLYHYTHYFPFPLTCSSFHTNYKKLHINPYFLQLHIIPLSTFYISNSMLSLVARSIAEPKLYFIISLNNVLQNSHILTPKGLNVCTVDKAVLDSVI
jgi:hypothetical protein